MADGIAAFWIWWKTARRRVEKAIADRRIDDIEKELTSRVVAIGKGLKWEIGPNEQGHHGLALCWEGDLRLRRLTQRWCEAAPTSKSWAFFPDRPRGDWKAMVMELEEHVIAFEEYACTFVVDDDRERVDVVLHHPVTAKAPEGVRATAGIVLLDRAFGEDGVERWIGAIEFATKKPRGAGSVKELVKAVGKLGKKATGDKWSLLQGERNGAPIVVARNAALKAIDHLACDHELEVAIEFDAEDTGLPSPPEADALAELEESLLEVLGDAGAYHGRETCAGTRSLYVFADRGVESRVAKWRKQQKKRAVTLTWAADPTWERLERWS